MHGDALCTDDRAYQRLRATVREADWQRQFLALSIASRRALAGAARAGSQAHTANLGIHHHRRQSPTASPGDAPSRHLHAAAWPHASARHSRR
jgi:UDP-2,3-diacylglucosamine pyrophosphatase LpxH